MRLIVMAALAAALGARAAGAQAAPAHAPAAGTLPEPGDDLAAFFAAMDKDSDGTLSRAEFDAWFHNMPVAAASGGDDGLSTYFGMMDANRDGKISRDEFVRFNAHVDRSGD